MRDVFHFDPLTVAVGDAASLPDAIGVGDRPFHVEVGFGKDVRILRAAADAPDEWFLGIEISRKKAESFQRKVARTGLRNVRAYLGDMRKVLAEMIPARAVDSFTVLFPDPWPKRRHWKNRWIQPETARRLVTALKPGGRLVVATDHDGYRDHIRTCLLGAGLELVYESDTIPVADTTLFAQRFERLGETVTYLRWRKAAA
ncbi:MAG: hypothetical protein OER88_11640 [Planctomycetota bacterium]|nr:hypothetical protein [Planctomycetota bacterium]